MKLRIAVMCSSHGLGHTARQLAVAEELLARSTQPVLFSSAPASFVSSYLPQLEHRSRTLDVGLIEPPGKGIDLQATRDRLRQVHAHQELTRLEEELSGFDRAIVDVAPMALEACRRARVPVWGVGNFDWAWVYGKVAGLADWSQRFRVLQQPHRALRVTPGPPLTGFHTANDVGLLARRRPAAVLPPRSVLVAFGGHDRPELIQRLPKLTGVTWVFSSRPPSGSRSDFLLRAATPFPAIVAGADAVLTKPGYGTLAEAMAGGTPIIWVERKHFPETPFLEAAMYARGDLPWNGREADLGRILEELWSQPGPAVRAAPAAAHIADQVIAG